MVADLLIKLFVASWLGSLLGVSLGLVLSTLIVRWMNDRKDRRP